MKRLILIAILALAFFLRFYHLSTNPPSLNWDEAAIGYNAHSILLTGRDEFGTKLPVYFRSFDDYKLPVYVYLAAASEKIFGYSSYSVRFPSTLAGVFAVWGIYLLTNQVFKKPKISFLAAFLLAVLPEHVQFSRMALEAAVASTEILFAVLAVFLAFKKPRWLIVAALLFSASIYTYLSPRVTIPLIILTIALLYGRKLIRNRRILFVAVAILGLCAIFLGRDMLSPVVNTRFLGLSSLKDSVTYHEVDSEIRDDGIMGLNLTRRLFHENQFITMAGIAARGYLVHFSTDFLFFDIGRDHHAPGVGLLYFPMLPLLLIGIYFSIKKLGKTSYFLGAWLLIAPIPSAVTWDIPNAIRVYTMFFPITIFSALGAYEFIIWTRKYGKKVYWVANMAILGTFFVSILYFLHQYQIHLPLEKSKEWMYGHEEMAQFALANKNNYKKIVFSLTIDRPLIYMLYYTKKDPANYLLQGGTKSGGWADQTEGYDNYEFHNFDYYHAPKGDILYVGTPQDFPKFTQPIKIIRYLDGTPAVYFVKT